MTPTLGLLQAVLSPWPGQIWHVQFETSTLYDENTAASFSIQAITFYCILLYSEAIKLFYHLQQSESNPVLLIYSIWKQPQLPCVAVLTCSIKLFFVCGEFVHNHRDQGVCVCVSLYRSTNARVG